MNTNHSRVLILDDDPADLAILADILRADHKIFAVLTAREAFEIVRQENVDIILLDIRRTDMDGYEICRQLKNDDDGYVAKMLASVTGRGGNIFTQRPQARDCAI